MLFSPKRRVVFIKTTCCFHQNDVLFSSKRRDVFIKTTCCFHQNDVLFSSKRRDVSIKRVLVFFKTTCCFHQNDVLFSMNILMWENSITKRKSIAKIPKCKNTYNLRVTRARVYAHYKSFCVFAVTSVTRIFASPCFSDCYGII